MNKRKSTKRALIMSAIALLLCVSMLAGSTYAWFTDSVSSMNNVIKSGNLDVELEYSVDGENWVAVDDDTSIFNEESLWEPGHTEAVALRVRNAGTLALKYALSTSIYLEKEGTNVYGETFKLSDYLEVYACGPQENNVVGEIMTGLVLGSRDKATGNGTGMTKTSFNKDLGGNPTLQPGAEDVMWVAITMPTTVGNEANYMTGTAAPYIRFGVNLYATQTPHEADSFGPDYDKDATYSKFPEAIVTDNGPQTVDVESLFGGGLFDENNNENIRNLDATFTFKPKDPSAITDYDQWIADYEVTVDRDLPENAAVLAGQYNANDDRWQAFYTPEVTANTPMRLLGSQGYDLSYELVRDFVGEFQCGVENLNVPEGTTMSVALKIYKQNTAGDIVAEHTVGVFTYTF